MATVTKKLLLDVSRKNLLPNVIAKQYDTDSRFLKPQNRIYPNSLNEIKRR